MASQASTVVLMQVLADVDQLMQNHSALRTGAVGRQRNLDALNRAGVVMLVSAWESYVEALALEAVEALKPTTPPLGTWPSILASVKGTLGRFNTPNSQNVDRLFAETLGINGVAGSWRWRGSSPDKASRRLDKLLTIRHKSVHGVLPRLVVHHKYVTQMRSFVALLANATDEHVRDTLISQYSVSSWT